MELQVKHEKSIKCFCSLTKLINSSIVMVRKDDLWVGCLESVHIPTMNSVCKAKRGNFCCPNFIFPFSQ